MGMAKSWRNQLKRLDERGIYNREVEGSMKGLILLKRAEGRRAWEWKVTWDCRLTCGEQ